MTEELKRSYERNQAEWWYAPWLAFIGFIGLTVVAAAWWVMTKLDDNSLIGLIGIMWMFAFLMIGAIAATVGFVFAVIALFSWMESKP